MAKKSTVEVWAGPGVLSIGRRMIKAGEAVPKELGKEARASFRGKGMIVDEIVDDGADLKVVADGAVEAANDAQTLSEEAMVKLGGLSKAVEDAAKAVSTAKGLRTKAVKAAEVEGASDDVKATAVEAATVLEQAEAASTAAASEQAEASADTAKLAENAARLRVAADQALAAIDG